MTLACPKCGSSNAQSLSLVHKEGLSSVAAKTRSFGLGVAEWHVGIDKVFGKEAGVIQTELSKRAAPPMPRKWFGLLCVAAISGLVFVNSVAKANSISLASSIVAVGCGWMALRAIRFNSATFPIMLANWEQSYLCKRCGVIFRRSIR